MISFEDCVRLCELTDEEIAVIARQKRTPELAAIELGRYLISSPNGPLRISSKIRDDIAAAEASGDILRAAKLKVALKYFMLIHHDGDAGDPLAAAA